MKGHLIKAAPEQKDFLTNQRVSTSPARLPSRGTHRAFQNPKEIGKSGRGLPANAQSTWKACRLSWPLPFLSVKHQQALREPSEMPVPAPLLKDSDERVLGGTWGSVSELSPGRCKTQFLCSSFSLTWIKTQGCANHTL